MAWTIAEIIKVIVLIALAVGLQQFIKRFGKTYVTDIFQSTPQIGKAFLALADVAYYLIFVAYILFNVHFERAGNWAETVNASQLQDSVSSIAGICLIIGVLHALNVFVVPFVGGILAFGERVRRQTEP